MKNKPNFYTGSDFVHSSIIEPTTTKDCTCHCKPCSYGHHNSHCELKPQSVSEDTETEIYNILYKHSRVDIIRFINEDEWPIKEIAQLLHSQRTTLIEKIEALRHKYAGYQEQEIYDEALDDVLALLQKHTGKK